MAEKTGVFNRLWIETATDTWSVLEFLPGTQLALQQNLQYSGAMTGSRQMPVARVRETARAVQGNLNMNPTAVELESVLPWAFSVAKDGSNDFIIPESHSASRTLRGDRDGTFNDYDGCVVSNFQVSSSEGGFLQMSLGIQGVDEATAEAAPSSPTAVTGSPYVFSDCVASVAGTAYQIRQFGFSVDHRLEVRSNNSLTPTSIRSTGMQPGIQLTIPFGDAAALYGAGAGGVAVIATFTNGAKVLTITAPAVVFPKPQIEFGTPSNMNFQLNGIPYRKADGTAAFTIRHVNG